ncbi:hypothetical protein DFP72DRAFT_506965 [Ephemerocybe angulata]|uniref:Uncharacterized protein n=1 Tax=Ephemerocybe angulata TaxID=980116 RepID=A0A8H6HS56_9AGAR|nr:hypothetical protein DFP72DRAFT_506965 [Tulosesus angulatus]
MASGKSRVGDEHAPLPADRHRNNPQYRVEEVRNASLGDNWGTMIQGAHSPKISTGTVTKSNARDQINVHGGKVKIYLSSDSRPPEMTLQRMGIARALSRVLSKIKSRPPPSEEPSSSTEDVVGRDLQHQDDSRAGRSESTEIDTSPSGSSFQEQETRFGKEREGITRTLPNRQAGLSLLPLDKLDPGSLGFSDSSNPIPAEIYVGSMLGYGLGLACSVLEHQTPFR